MADECATKDSWKTVPMSSCRINLPLELRLSGDELVRLKRGSIPEEMEDKWFVYHEDGWVYFHRSWTGFCIYQLRLVEDGDVYRCTEAWVTRDREQYTSEDIGEDRQLLESLLF